MKDWENAIGYITTPADDLLMRGSGRAVRRHRRPPAMRAVALLVVLGMALTGCSSPDDSQVDDEDFVPIGESLDEWEGDLRYWSIQDGVITGRTTPETALESNSFLIWRGGTVDDFELKTDFRVSSEGNSGIQYRSVEVEDADYTLQGYQADIDGPDFFESIVAAFGEQTGAPDSLPDVRFTGSNYEEGGRTTLASLGEATVIPTVEPQGTLADHVEANRWSHTEVARTLGSVDEMEAQFYDGDWNEIHIVAEGNTLRHYVNGVLTSEVTDNDTANRRMEGLLGVQVHVGPPMTIEYRNMRIKPLE